MMWRLPGIVSGVLLAAAALPAVAQPACERPFEDVFEDVSPSVVSILAVSVDPQNRSNRVRAMAGAGIILDAQGRVLTNAHVVYGGDTVAVSVAGRGVVPAQLLGLDPVLDLAVLQLAAADGPLPFAALGDSTGLRVGQDVLAVGNAFGLGLSASRGIVSGLNRVVRRSPMSWLAPLVQTDAAINAGSSGGPLVDRCGDVVGINTFRLSQGNGVGFAVPADLIAEAVPELVAAGRIERPWHGINGKMVSTPLLMLLRLPLVRGFLVETVEPGSAADAIGLRGGDLPVRLGSDDYLLGGDIITHVNGEPLTDLGTAMHIVRSLGVGDTVTVEYFRNGLTFTAESVLTARPILESDLAALRSRQAAYRSGFTADPADLPPVLLPLPPGGQ